MKYTNVPLPTPIIKRIDSIISKVGSDYRSRPDYILHHIRNALQKHIENVEQNTTALQDMRKLK